MNHFNTYAAAAIFAEKMALPTVVIYCDYVLGFDTLQFIVPMP